jgi:hypothetical protein
LSKEINNADILKNINFGKTVLVDNATEEEIKITSESNLTESNLMFEETPNIYNTEQNHIGASINIDKGNENLQVPERVPAYHSEQCLIVKGLNESEDPIAKNRITHDLLKFKEYVTPLLREGENIEICKAFRLGQDRSATSPRPLKLILKSKQQRDILLQRKPAIRGGEFKIFFQQEYSPREREKYRELYQKMQLMIQNGEKYLTIKNGQIVKKNYSYLWTSPVVISTR